MAKNNKDNKQVEVEVPSSKNKKDCVSFSSLTILGYTESIPEAFIDKKFCSKLILLLHALVFVVIAVIVECPLKGLT